LKFIHFSRDNFYANENLKICTNNLLINLGFKPLETVVQQLIFLRNTDKKIGAKAPK